MLKKTLVFLAAYLLAISPTLFAQVQLGGHVYVPSTTDSTNGLSILEIVGAPGTCNIVALTTGCSLENSAGGAPGLDAPWVGTIRLNGALSGGLLIYIPYTPGRSYTIINQFSVLASITVQGWNVATSSPQGDIITAPPNASITLLASINASNTNSYEPVGGNSIPKYVYVDSSEQNVGLTTAPEVAGTNTNTIVGANAANSIQAGAQLNTPIGYNALEHLTTGASNIGVGQGSCNNVTTGNGNTCIGPSQLLNASDTNEIVVSSGPSPTTGNGSNTLTIGNSSTNASYLYGVLGVAVSGSDCVTISSDNQLGDSGGGCGPNVSLTCNADGCYRVTSDGQIEEWGTITASTTSATVQTVTLTFPYPFSNANSLTENAGSDPDASNNDALTLYHINKTLTGATFVLRCASNIGGSGCPSISNAIPIDWHALGY